MKDAKYKWEHHRTEFIVSEKLPTGWRALEVFYETNAVTGRKRCEDIIDRHANPRAAFYYDGSGRQLPGFDIG